MFYVKTGRCNFTFIQVEHRFLLWWGSEIKNKTWLWFENVTLWIKTPVFVSVCCRTARHECHLLDTQLSSVRSEVPDFFFSSSLCLMLLILLRKLCKNQTPPTWVLTPPVRLGLLLLLLPSEQLRPQRKCVYKWKTPLCDKATLDLLKSTPKCTRALSGRKTGAPFIPLGCGGEAAEGDEHPVYFKCVKCGEERQAGTTRCCLSTSSRPRSASPLQ